MAYRNLLLFVALLCTLAASAPTPNPPQVNAISLKRRQVTPEIQRRRLAARQSSELSNLGLGDSTLAAQVYVGSQTLELTFDTGSSDLWVVGSDTVCVDGNGNQVDSSNCDFGPGYDTGDGIFDQTSSSWSIGYYGESASGIAGLDTVSLAGVTVTGQEIGVATQAQFSGNGVISGIVGLGTHTSDGSSALLNTMFNVEQVAAPQFALAISRDASGSGNAGILTIGGAPSLSDPTVNASTPWYSTPWQVAVGQTVPGYTINVDSINWGTGFSVTEGSTNVQMTLDTGNPNICLPTEDADGLGALFNPPATKVGQNYEVDCNAAAPNLVFRIGGGLFQMNPTDLIHQSAGSTTCSCAFFDSGSGASAFGEPFFKNVVALHDWGNQLMTIAGRMYYES